MGVLRRFLGAFLYLLSLTAWSQNTVFSDSFERFNNTEALLTSGPQAPYSWGNAPNHCTGLVSFDIQNDRNHARNNELAYSAIPIAQSQQLLATDQLIVVGPGEQRLPAQFQVLSRWSSGPDDLSAPIRWLNVLVKAQVDQQNEARYSLRLCPESVADATPSLQVTPQAQGFTINTVGAIFQMDTQSASPLSSIQIQNQTIPLSVDLVLQNNQGLVTTETGVLSLVEQGPVRTIFRHRGHFTDSATCGFPPSYDIWYTFVLGESDVLISSDFINECGDGMNAAGSFSSPGGQMPWWNQFYTVNEFSLNVRINQTSSPIRYLGHHALTASELSDPSGIRLAQLNGQDSNVNDVFDWRRSELRSDSNFSNLISEPTTLETPFVGLADQNIWIGASIAWMRYREPQALEASQQTLRLKWIEGFRVGEAQGIWNQSILRFQLAGDAPADNQLNQTAQMLQSKLERGLSIHSPISYLNSTRVFPVLPEPNESFLLPQFRTWMDQLHQSTVGPGGQWERIKSFSLNGWPDVLVEGAWEQSSNNHLDQFSPGSNLWSPSNTELLMWFIDGDPKWLWDFALPQEWTLLKTNAYNTGSRGDIGERNGFVILSGSSGGDAMRFRAGFGTDDKLYNQGSGKAYLARPDYSIQERFAAAGDTFIDRYTDNPNGRDFYLAARILRRGVMQHVNMLQYASDFVPTQDQRYLNKLNHVMTEFAQDNFFGGVPCEEDDRTFNESLPVLNDNGSPVNLLDDYWESGCAVSPSGMFHHAALGQELFMQYALHHTTSNEAGIIRGALAQTGRLLFDHSIARNSGTLNIDTVNWGNTFMCDLSQGGHPSSICQAFNCVDLKQSDPGQSCESTDFNPNFSGINGVDSIYSNAFLPIVSVALMAHTLDTNEISTTQCQQLRSDLAILFQSNGVVAGYFERGITNQAGYFKDVNQMTQLALYGLGAAATCP